MLMWRNSYPSFIGAEDSEHLKDRDELLTFLKGSQKAKVKLQMMTQNYMLPKSLGSP